MTTEKLAEDLLTLWRILRGLSHPVRRAEMTPEQYWLLRILNRADKKFRRISGRSLLFDPFYELSCTLDR